MEAIADAFGKVRRKAEARQEHAKGTSGNRDDRFKKRTNARDIPIVRGLQHASRVWHTVRDGVRRLAPRQTPGASEA
jgi:hypothetical protein